MSDELKKRAGQTCLNRSNPDHDWQTCILCLHRASFAEKMLREEIMPLIKEREKHYDLGIASALIVKFGLTE